METREATPMSWVRRAGLSLVILTALAGGVASPPPARAAGDLRVCGVVTAYLPASALLPGTLMVGPTPLVVAAGTTLHSSVAVGANLCFDVSLNLLGAVTGATITANVTSTVTLCGRVTAYTAGTPTAAGSLAINGRTFELAAGSSLPASVSLGADVCASLTLNGFGQVTAATVQANVTTVLAICGVVDGFAAASLTSNGSLTIGGQSFVVAAGASLPAAVSVGADLCFQLTLNGIGQVSNAAVQANLAPTVDVSPTISIQVPVPGSSPEPENIAAASPQPGASEGPGSRGLTRMIDALDARPSSNPAGIANDSGVAPLTATHAPAVDPPSAPAVAETLVNPGQILPDTASLGRTGMVILQVSMPLLLLLVGLLARELVRRRTRVAGAARGHAGSRGA
jgi:hypothetical protein